MLTQVYIHFGVALAGLVSFLSPCVLPLVPPYLGYLGGTTIEQMTDKDELDARLWRRVVLASRVLRAGLHHRVRRRSAPARRVFGQWMQTHKAQLSIVAGIVIIAVRPALPGAAAHPAALSRGALPRQRRGREPGRRLRHGAGLRLRLDAVHRAGAGDRADLAANEASLGAGVRLLLVYSLGLGIPFVLAAMAIGPFLGFLQRFRQHLRPRRDGDGRAAGGDGRADADRLAQLVRACG